MRYIFLLVLLGTCTVKADGPAESIQESMKRADLGAKIDFIEPSQMPGLYTVGLEGGRVLYASEDGQFFIQGRLYKAQEGKTINLTDKAERKGVAKAIAEIDESEMIIFPASKEDSVITVFTDTSCPFCHKLHEEIKDLNNAGITVRYLAYPRQGLDSEAYRTMISVWCSVDRKDAFSEAIDGEEIDGVSCNAPVKEHYLLGQQIGFQGTPAIIFDNGAILSGYRPAKTIQKIIENIKRES
ncbi:bifunctional protein-disulfide isomerase/oxidoreductase DsbC [Alloalcanivorax venustensis]